MKRQSIFIIIGLMSLALLGLAGIQAYWINRAIELNEKNFDFSIYEALKKTTDRLQKAEENFSMEGWSWIAMEKRFPVTENDSFSRREDLPGYMTYEMDIISKWYDGMPLDERIIPSELDTILRQELKNFGVELDYNYGVYSFSDKDIVIENGHFTYFDDDKPLGTLTPFNKTLLDSKYKVQLFTNDPEPPGLLVIQFPQRSTVVYGSVVGIITMSVLFTLLVLFCFSYTVYVIFRQKKLSEMKNDFINNMTHELKTPIATISLAADSINSPVINTSPEKIMRFATIIKQENDRMLNQVEKVLQMALIDTNQLSLSLMELRVNEMLTSVVENNRLRVEQKGGRIRFEKKAENDTIYGDRTHVSNVFYNLVDNAIKYTPDAPDIEISTMIKGRYIVVGVKDNGMGMSKEQKKHVFDRFYRAQTGNLHDVKGFGLGLSYVKEMVDAHKGLIEIESELNQGSAFYIYFPLYTLK